MKTVGQGVRELRVRDQSGAFRVVYVATFADAVYVLHCFRKKTQRTAVSDIRLARQRYGEIARKRR
jgi:phage-related protein